MKRLWAPWRMAYVGGSRACIFSEALSATDDRRSLVVRRARNAYLIVHAHPYAPGHVMAVLNRHVGRLSEATDDELADAMALIKMATVALSTEYRSDGFNVGMNQGRVAGAGVDEHLHLHVVPAGMAIRTS